jgi:hypothetical protein
MLHRATLRLFLLAAILSAGGCGRAVTEGLGAVRGPQGVAVVVEPVSPYRSDFALGQYTHFQLGTITDEFGRTPRRFFLMFPQDFTNALMDKRMLGRSGGKTLLIRGKIIHFEDTTRVTSHLFGPFEEIIARIELVDKDTGRVLGVADCVGRSTESVNQGLEKKSAGLAMAIVEWIVQHQRRPGERSPD